VCLGKERRQGFARAPARLDGRHFSNDGRQAGMPFAASIPEEIMPPPPPRPSPPA
jgi:hypothetical protein